jgi:DNA-binding NtrC family response regulator
VRQARLVHESTAIDDVMFEARKVADTDATVLITGESGTGKGLLAETLHHMSRRRRGPFIVVDCSAIPTNLVESELFGHERGAFTGALSRSPGRVVQADGGTLFLDEVGELPLEVQAKLLRLVEDRQFTSVGSHQARRVDVRLVAATNRELLREVEQGRFRLDLYHRLSVVPLELPPLRDRDKDVLLLARHFLASFATKYQKPARRLSPELERQMLAYHWPGNVRELQNRLLRAVLLADNDVLTPAQLALPVEDVAPAAGAHASKPVLASAANVTELPRASGDASLSQALAGAVDAVVNVLPRMRPPLGRWLADDLVLVAFRECGGIGRRAAASVGVPETTYARRLQRAQRDAQMSQRPAYWAAVNTALVQMVRSAMASPRQACLLDAAELCLIAEIERRFSGDARAGAALLGTSLATYRRRQTAFPLAS